MSERKVKVIKLIYDNPGLSGNELYKQTVSQGYGIKKQDFYQTIRTIRKIPEPTIEKKEKAIPIKYRKPTKPIITIKDIPIPKKRGAYGIVFVEAEDDVGNEKEFWVKYETRKSLKEQLNNLKKKYKAKIKQITFEGFGSYTGFIDAEFKKLLKSVGIDL